VRCQLQRLPALNHGISCVPTVISSACSSPPCQIKTDRRLRPLLRRNTAGSERPALVLTGIAQMAFAFMVLAW